MKETVSDFGRQNRRVIATNGTVFRVSPRGATQIVLSMAYFWVMAAFSVVVALFNAPLFGMDLPLLGRFGYWFFDCAIVTAIWIGLFWAVAWIDRATGIALPFYGPVVCMCGVAGMVWANYGLERVLFGLDMQSAGKIWGEVLRYTLIAVVFDLLTSMFILPWFPQVSFERVNWGFGARAEEGSVAEVPEGEANADAAAAAGNAGNRRDALVLPGGKSMPLDGLMYMKSVEHYVEFIYREGQRLERATLRALVEQIDPEAGIQTHRSYWVNSDAISGLSRKNGNLALVLSDDTEIPVSRTRRKLVSDWVAGGDRT